jgi:8-amino-7-oxononanoate synthase
MRARARVNPWFPREALKADALPAVWLRRNKPGFAESGMPRTSVDSVWEAALADGLATREADGLLRTLRPYRRAEAGKVVTPEGRELLDLSSNDYLGLASHPALAEATARAAYEHGTGGTASRLIVGDSPAYHELEQRLAEHKGTEAALVLGSGYAANVGVIPALAGRGDAIFSDRLNHASIVDGCRLSRAEVHRYRHADAAHLEQLLRASHARRKLIVTDTVFSMDGDVAPLREIVELKERYDAGLLVDEAHAAGVFGPHGEGLARELAVEEGIDLQLGTFSKAFGVYGACVAGREMWIRHLQNTCRSLIYSTALPPPVVAAAATALELVRSADRERAALRDRANRFRDRLSGLGLDTCGSTTQIVPIVVGDPERALAWSHALEEHGVLGVAVRPPTVPVGTARIRLSLSAAHADHDLERALDAVGSIASEGS